MASLKLSARGQAHAMDIVAIIYAAGDKTFTMATMGVAVGYPNELYGKIQSVSRVLPWLRDQGFLERGQGRGLRNQPLRLTDAGVVLAKSLVHGEATR